jgi:hypothetical protein
VESILGEGAGLLLNEENVAWVLTAVALVCTWVPFQQGLRLCLRGWAATRRVEPRVLRKVDPHSPASGPEPLALLMVRILRKSLQENEREDHPADFVFDATRQYVMNEFEIHYTRLITMLGSLLPPIGFIGTTGGMLILFLSMQLSNTSLELGALALALTSSIFALIGFSILEALKIRLYARLLASLHDVQALFDEANTRREAKSRVAAA